MQKIKIQIYRIKFLNKKNKKNCSRTLIILIIIRETFTYHYNQLKQKAVITFADYARTINSLKAKSFY